MNKKLLALAVAGAFAAPAAMAQTNVTLYGTAAMSVDLVDGGSGGGASLTSQASDSRWRVSSNTSLFGLRIKEDLGNGLDAHAQLETAINIDTGGGIGWGGTTGNRNNFVGFGSKSWGAIDFGLIDSPLKTSTGRLDLFGGGHTIADYRSLFVTGSSIDSVRKANSVYYTSPNFSGFAFKAQTAATTEDGSTQSPNFYSLSAEYANGPIFAVLAYEKNETVGSAGTSALTVASIGGQTLAAGAAGDSWESDVTTWRAGFGYNFGTVRVGVAYQNVDTDVKALSGTLTGTLADSATGTSYDRDSWHVSAGWNITKATMLAAQYTNAGKINEIANSGAYQWTLGVRHDLSKRTNVYALYTRVNNDSAASYSLGGGATGTQGISAAAAGEDPSAFSVGVVHRF